MDLIVDVQGFCIPHFIIKEVAVLSRDGAKQSHYIVKPPVEWKTLDAKCKNNVRWLFHNHHGVAWNDGYVEYEEMMQHLKQLLQTAFRVYVKGDMKKNFIEEIFDGEIINLNHEPSVKNFGLKKTCFAHAPHHSVCALNNVYIIKAILDVNIMTEKIINFENDILDLINSFE